MKKARIIIRKTTYRNDYYIRNFIIQLLYNKNFYFTLSKIRKVRNIVFKLSSLSVNKFYLYYGCKYVISFNMVLRLKECIKNGYSIKMTYYRCGDCAIIYHLKIN